MDFALTEEALELQAMVKDFVDKEVVPYTEEMDRENKARPEIFQKAGDMGLLNLVVPEEYGGPGLDSITIATIYEELGKGCAGIATSIAANALASYPILLAGNEEQKKYQCDLLNDGKLAAFALTEPGAGSDAGAVSTKAVKDGDHYVLNGNKVFITNGGIADSFLVFANKDTPGFSVGRKEDKMGIRPSNTCELILEDVVVPESMRVGLEGQGFRIAMNTLDSARPFVAAVAVGLAQSCLDIASHYARERRQFGQPIASFQMVQGMVADMAMKVATARLLVQKACWMRDQGMEFGKEAAMSKCYASDVAMEVATDAVQIMGGYGYMKDYPMEKKMRDAKILQIYEGTNQIQRTVIANKILY